MIYGAVVHHENHRFAREVCNFLIANALISLHLATVCNNQFSGRTEKEAILLERAVVSICITPHI